MKIRKIIREQLEDMFGEETPDSLDNWEEMATQRAQEQVEYFRAVGNTAMAGAWNELIRKIEGGFIHSIDDLGMSLEDVDSTIDTDEAVMDFLMNGKQ